MFWHICREVSFNHQMPTTAAVRLVVCTHATLCFRRLLHAVSLGFIFGGYLMQGRSGDYMDSRNVDFDWFDRCGSRPLKVSVTQKFPSV